MIGPLLVTLACLVAGLQEKTTPRLMAGDVLLHVTSTDRSERAEVAQALGDDDALVRAAAARVLIAYGEASAVAPLLQALKKEADPLVTAEMIRAALVLGNRDSLPALEEAARRVGGRAVVVLAQWYAGNDVARLEQWLPAHAERLDPTAAITISRVLHGIGDNARAAAVGNAWATLLEQRGIRAAAGLGSVHPVSPELRVIRPWAPGLLDAVAKAAECKIADTPTYGFAKLAFGPRARLSSVTLGQSGLSKQCTKALTALVLSEVAEFDRSLPPGTAQWVMVPFGHSFFACNDHGDDEPLRVGEDGIAAPRKTKDQRPVYPSGALAEKREGIVVAESVISSHGCVKELRIVKSAGLDLDVAGLLAVSQWEFEPTRQGSQAIPVRMTVTVTFSIRP